MAARMEILRKREEENAVKQAMKEEERQRAMALKEAERLEKMRQKAEENERKQRETEEAARKRAHDLAIKEEQRHRYMSEQNARRREASQQKSLAKQEKIALAKEAAEAVLLETRRRFAERETISYNRRLEFEAGRKRSFDAAKMKARAKSLAMKKAFDDAKQIEAKRREDMLEVMKKTEVR